MESFLYCKLLFFKDKEDKKCSNCGQLDFSEYANLIGKEPCLFYDLTFRAEPAKMINPVLIMKRLTYCNPHVRE